MDTSFSDDNWGIQHDLYFSQQLLCNGVNIADCNGYFILRCMELLMQNVWVYRSLMWPDHFSSHGAYCLEIISACSEKGIVQNQYANLFSHPKPELRVLFKLNQLWSQNVYFL